LKRILLIFFVCLLFASSSACGKSRAFSFAVIDGDEEYTLELEAGEVLSRASRVYTAAGDVFYAEDYVISEPLHGVILDPPDYSVRDVFNETKAALDAEGKILIVFIDGFGWKSYEAALERGDIPNLARLNSNIASSVFPTITPVNYAAMVTGTPPIENGVTERGIHSLSGDTIFDYAASIGKSASVIEGDSQIFSFSVKQELNPDSDSLDGTDNEIFQSAMAAKQSGCDLLFVHFHGVDDVSHTFGPESEEAAEKIKQIDGYFGELSDGWSGKIIVVADHGQHENDGGDPAYENLAGKHGSFTASDIFVPFLMN